MLAPDDQRRQLPGEVEPVGGAHTLATEIDDTPHGVQERLAGVGVLERHEVAPNLLEVGARAESGTPERVRDLPTLRRPATQSQGSTLRRPAAPPPGAAGGAHDRGRRSRPARGARSAPGTGRRTASRPRRRANARRSFRAPRRAPRAGRESRSRRHRASSLPAAWTSPLPEEIRGDYRVAACRARGSRPPTSPSFPRSRGGEPGEGRSRPSIAEPMTVEGDSARSQHASDMAFLPSEVFARCRDG